MRDIHQVARQREEVQERIERLEKRLKDAQDTIDLNESRHLVDLEILRETRIKLDESITALNHAREREADYLDRIKNLSESREMFIKDIETLNEDLTTVKQHAMETIEKKTMAFLLDLRKQFHQ